MALQEAPYDRVTPPTVKLLNPMADGGFVASESLIVAQVLGPGGAMIAFNPQHRIREVPEQRPAACAIASPDFPSLRHHTQKFNYILIGDPILNRDDDGATARLHWDYRIRLAKFD
jgi:hypothetical protein